MEENLEIRISNALKRCEGQVLKECRGHFSRVYPFTTENISGYIDYFPLKNNSLLTVGSSGDQVFNAILKGCHDIEVLDINPYTKYYYYLKASGIISLDYSQFLEFFRFKDYPKVFKENPNVFNLALYEKIEPILKELDLPSFIFWKKLFTTTNPKDIRRYLFQMDEDRTDTIMGCNPYLQTIEDYNLLKEKLFKINPSFTNTNIFQYNFSKKYDNIWLSNIGSYLDEEGIKKFSNIVEKGLNPSGKILISYLYNTKTDKEYNQKWIPIYNIEFLRQIFSNYDLELLTFLGVQGIKFSEESQKDSIVMCKKKQRVNY